MMFHLQIGTHGNKHITGKNSIPINNNEQQNSNNQTSTIVTVRKKSN